MRHGRQDGADSGTHAGPARPLRGLQRGLARGVVRWGALGAGLTAAAVSAALLTAPQGGARAADAVVTPLGGAWTVKGHGWGHGHGMSQWGAQSRAAAGQTAEQILAAYYPGTGEATAQAQQVRVGLTTWASDTVRLRSTGSAALSVSTSARTVPAGEVLVLTRSGTAVVGTATLGDGTTDWTETWTSTPEVSAPDHLVAVVGADGSGSVYQGTIRIPVGTGALTPLNVLDLDDYVRGVVPNESPASWDAAALQAQAVAARSYALSTLTPSGAWDVCDTDACQVYRGYATTTAAGATTSKQPASTNAAVAATAYRYRTYGGAPAFTQFSSSDGGWTAAGSKPYLAASADPYSVNTGSATGDSVGTWTASLPVSTVSARCPSGGTAIAIQPTGRDGNGEWGGRLTALRVTCTTGTVVLTGASTLRMGLRSEWWMPVPSLSSGAVTAAWAAAGGTTGPLGDPTGDETPTPDGRGTYEHFTGGSVYWTPGGGAHVVSGAVYDAWAARGWERSALGFPTTDAGTTPDGTASFQHFQHGSLYVVTAASGGRAAAVTAAVRDGWARLGWERSWLGYPVSDTRTTPDGKGSFGAFDGGVVYASAAGAHPVDPALYGEWASWNWEKGALGYPATDPGTTPGGATFQHFTGGSIYRSDSGGTHAVTSAVRGAWARLGWERSPLGYPSADSAVLPDGRGQIGRFTGGTVYWSSPTGSHAVWGATGDAWAATDWEKGWLGYPTSDPATTPDGLAAYQHFTGGSVYVVGGAARTLTAPVVGAWAGTGWERGALGYPTASTQPTPNGSTTRFDHGTVSVDAAGRAAIHLG